MANKSRGPEKTESLCQCDGLISLSDSRGKRQKSTGTEVQRKRKISRPPLLDPLLIACYEAAGRRDRQESWQSLYNSIKYAKREGT
jgi:hypothetical protein